MSREILKVRMWHVPESSPEVQATKKKRQEELTKDVGGNRILGDYEIVQLDKYRNELQRLQAGDPEIWREEKKLAGFDRHEF